MSEAPSSTPFSPRYGQDTLADLLPSVAASLGVSGERDVLGLPAAHQACVLLVDGLGESLLRRHAQAAPFLSSLARVGPRSGVLTTGFPSTTATSLALLGVGRPPGEHGLVGYTMAIPGSGRLLNALRWDPEVDPRRWQPHLTVFERAEAAGVAVTQVNSPRFAGSGLTTAALRGGRYVGVQNAAEQVSEVAAALRVGRRGLVYTYHADLDAAGHSAGVASGKWLDRLRGVDRLARRLAATLPARSALYVTGDHGMLDVPPDTRLDLAERPRLCEGLLLLGGEPRARHLYTRPGAAADVLAAWREAVGERAWTFSRDEAVALGLFGPKVADATLPRIGDVVVAARGQFAVVHTEAEPSEASVIGAHGSLTEVEREVPLLAALT